MTAREEAERLLAEHERLLPDRCACGLPVPQRTGLVPWHRAHVAQVLDEAGLLAEPRACDDPLCGSDPHEHHGDAIKYLPKPASAPSEDVWVEEPDEAPPTASTATQRLRAFTADQLAAHDAQIRAEAHAQPHECEGQRQLAALVKVVRDNPAPDIEAQVRADERRQVLTELDKHLLRVAEGKYDYADFVDRMADLVRGMTEEA